MGSPKDEPDANADTVLTARGAATNDDPLVLPVDDLARYRMLELLGRGGMGEVGLVRDERIQREVAIKRMRREDASPGAASRFLREAIIQAQLEHPAIVPVYELGRDASGQPYFTMKRISGTTLADLLARRTETRERLLRAFVDVVQAIDFAHARGFIHRDLKPANIMLGDFGEVYVLDWGLARVLERRADSEPSSQGDDDALPGVTVAGTVLGTPGYMPPEQLEDASRVTRAADVYALGAILFEILAGEPVHPREAPIEHTLGSFERAPGKRRPEREVPPELDAVCVRALATDPAKRPTARGMAEEVQRFLDGDRDEALRRRLASDAVMRAQVAFAEDRREEAMRTAARALALDPRSGAAEIVTRLVLEPPKVAPPGLQAELEAAEAGAVSRHARIAMIALAAWVVFLPFGIWTGIRDWAGISAMYAIVLALGGTAWLLGRRPELRHRLLWFYAAAHGGLVLMMAKLYGPLIIAPGVAATIVTGISTYPIARGKQRVMAGIVASGWIAAVVMEAVGAMPSTWAVRDGVIESRSQLLEIGGLPTTILALGISLGTILLSGVVSASAARAQHQARAELLRQRWQLARLLPEVTAQSRSGAGVAASA